MDFNLQFPEESKYFAAKIEQFFNLNSHLIQWSNLIKNLIRADYD